MKHKTLKEQQLKELAAQLRMKDSTNKPSEKRRRVKVCQKVCFTAITVEEIEMRNASLNLQRYTERKHSQEWYYETIYAKIDLSTFPVKGQFITEYLYMDYNLLHSVNPTEIIFRGTRSDYFNLLNQLNKREPNRLYKQHKKQ